MARSIVLSNGELAVALDDRALVRDVYYPHVGLEDHVRGHYIHHVGVFADGEISWLQDSSWQITIAAESDALCSDITAINANLQVQLKFSDIVYHERPIFFRTVKITNLGKGSREIKLFFGQQFELTKMHGGDTAYYDPTSHSIIHYKGQRVFQIRAELDGQVFSEYAIGIANFHGKEGSWRDADDGVLSKNPIEHGPVDSVIGLYGTYEQGGSKTCHYYMVAGHSIELAQALSEYVAKKTPEALIRSTKEKWARGFEDLQVSGSALGEAEIALFKHSLMHARAHVDLAGGIIASLDSDMLQYGLDTYSYVWPRDAVYVALAFDEVGEGAVMKRLLRFLAPPLTHDGYLMHKYLPDGSLGSSWHPWIRGEELQLPIQEDETALFVYGAHRHYVHTQDLETIRMLYPAIERAADFLLHYRDKATGLPGPSYDLWEEKRGISTYTSAAVYGALMSAAALFDILGKQNASRYQKAADEIKAAILKHLWDEKTGTFIKMLRPDGGADNTLDSSSAYGIESFGVLPPEDERLLRAWDATAKRLSFGIEAGGLARYEGDQYYRSVPGPAGNPWIITTLWWGEYLIAAAKTRSDLNRVKDIFAWTSKHMSTSGVLPEQLDPATGAPLSATPLTWSHAAYVSAVLKYLKRYSELAA